jgi:hypothetical protein
MFLDNLDNKLHQIAKVPIKYIEHFKFRSPTIVRERLPSHLSHVLNDDAHIHGLRTDLLQQYPKLIKHRYSGPITIIFAETTKSSVHHPFYILVIMQHLQKSLIGRTPSHEC